MKNIISNRIADATIYNNRSFYDELKEYYTLVLSEIRRIFNSPASLLDIGCANGSFIYHAQDFLDQTRLFGAEPVAELANIAQENTSAKIIKAGLFDLEVTEKYQVITMLGVLGIFSDATDVLKKIKELIEPGGGVHFFSI